MKKTSILSLVAFMAILMMVSCSKPTAKKIDLKTQNDSLNYTLGLMNGEAIKQNVMAKDSSDEAINALIKAIETAYSKKLSNDEMFKLGEQIGNSFKQQKAQGLMGDSTLVFDVELVKQGLINALKEHKEGMTSKEAEAYLQNTMMQIQTKRMAEQQQGVATQLPSAVGEQPAATAK